MNKYNAKKLTIVNTIEKSKGVLEKTKKELLANMLIKSIKRIMKLIGLDFIKKLASIVSFVIFAV